MSIFKRKNENADDLPMYTDLPADADGDSAQGGGLRSNPAFMMTMSIILAVVLVCVTGFMIYRTHAISSSNSKLESRVQRDTKLQKSEDEYESETDDLNSESENLIDRYGAGNTPEKTIMFLVNLSSTSGLSVNSITFGDEENVTVDENGKKLKGAAKAPDPTKEDTDSDSASTDTNSGTDTTNTDSDTTDSSSGSLSSESETAESGTSSDSDSNSDSESSDDKYYLYRYQVTFEYTGTYSELRDAIQFIEDYGERVTVNDMTATYDETTQELTGAITLNMYTLTGTAKQYTAPSVSGNVGNADIFGSVGSDESSAAAGTTTDTTTNLVANTLLSSATIG